jgi:hypothetical protein
MMPNAKTDASSATAADRAQKLVARPATPANADLAERACEHYLARGGEHGHDVDDWARGARTERRFHAVKKIAMSAKNVVVKKWRNGEGFGRQPDTHRIRLHVPATEAPRTLALVSKGSLGGRYHEND